MVLLVLLILIPFSHSEHWLTEPVCLHGTAPGPFQFVLVISFTPACASASTAATGFRHLRGGIDIVQEQQHSHFQNVLMWDITIFWNLDIADKFFVNILWYAELFLLTINKESLFIAS